MVHHDTNYSGPFAGFTTHYTKLLEYNPSPLTPWLTVSTAQDEIAILQVREESEFVDEYDAEVVRG